MNIEHLPRDWPDNASFLVIAAKYRDLRLQSLKLAPNAYASTYDQEVKFEPGVWRQRLTNPEVQHIVIARETNAIKASAGYEGEAETKTKSKNTSDCEWVGMIVVVESPTKSIQCSGKSAGGFNDSKAINDRGVTTKARCDWAYQLNALFVHPSVRRLGLGEALVKSGIECARIMANRHGLSHADISIMLDSWNDTARRLYGKHGFVELGEEEYTVGESKRRALTMLCNIPCKNKTTQE